MYTLKNEFISLTLDEKARLVSFENLKTGHGNIISSPRSIFRASLHTGENWDNLAKGEDADLDICVEGNMLTVAVRTLNTRMGAQDIRITMTLQLEGEQLRCNAVIENHSESTVNDFVYPVIGAIKTMGCGTPGLLYPNCFGQYHNDIAAELYQKGGRNGGMTLTTPYPYTLSMQWMTLIDQDQCLYFSGHDALFHASSLRAVGSDDLDVTLEMDKFAFAAPGETWYCPDYILWLYQGVWQQGADEYRAWASTWRKPVTPKKWMQEMNGYFLVINKQQYGDEMWPYSTIPHLYDLAREHGCDTVGLFGWFQSGHDNLYPDLEVSHTMGGEQLLKDGIRNIQDRGGHVTLYYQGHLIDMGSKFYTSGVGARICGKSRWGTPYFEEYSKSGESDFLRHFSRKIFVTVCPWCEEWHDLMVERASWVRSFGADGILYDQIGGINPAPCFDPSHGHTKPSLSYTQGRLKLLSAIRAGVDQHKDFSFMTENITDVYSQFIDVIHGIGSTYGSQGERTVLAAPSAPHVLHVPEMFRYTFPGTISTIRNVNPYIDQRFANYALTYGFRLEMELRYDFDIDTIETDTYPDRKAYAKAVADIRKEHMDLLLKGTYSCDSLLTAANPVLQHGVFTSADEKRCVVFWNDTAEEQPLPQSHYCFRKWIAPVYQTKDAADFQPGKAPILEGTTLPDTIAANSVLILFE